MFERYTEKARRVIFFARYETSQFGKSQIETEHLLLGLLRDDEPLAARFLPPSAPALIRKRIEEQCPKGEKISLSVDLPLSHESERILAYAAEEAERLNHQHIGTEHLVLGLLREEKCFAAELLREHGLSLELVRREVATAKSTLVADPKAGGMLTAITACIAKRALESKISFAFDYHFSTQSGRDIVADIAILSAEIPGAIQLGTPLVCVEVVIYDVGLRETRRRIDDYLGAGVRYVWLLDFKAKRAYAATAETGLREVKDSALRTENPVLELPLAEIFE